MTTLTMNETEKFEKTKGFAKKLGACATLVGLAFVPELLVAGGTGGNTGIAAVLQFFTDNLNGVLGQLIIIAMITVGLIGGIANQSLMTFAIGVGGGIGLANIQAIVVEIMGAGVVHAESVTSTLHLMNGLQ